MKLPKLLVCALACTAAVAPPTSADAADKRSRHRNRDRDSLVLPHSPALAGSTNFIYVDDDGAQQPGFDPAAPAGSFNNPYVSIQTAADLVQPGDTVLIRAGTYSRDTIGAFSGTLEISTAGTAEQPITFKNYNDEEVIVDAQGDAQFFAIRVGNPIIVAEAPAQHLVIEGLRATNASRNGIFVHTPTNVVIRNCEAYGNNQEFETLGFTNSSHSGILVVGGQDCTIEGCRVYDNGYGITLRERNETAAPVGSHHCTIRNNFVYGNANTGNYNNAGGINVRFGKHCTVERNVLWDNPDGSVLGLGMIHNKVIGNACLHSWQAGGNGEGIKICVRGGGANVIAFNLMAFNSQRGFDAADGIGDLLINNTTYRNREWGYLLEGRQTLVLNSIGFDDFFPFPNIYPQEFALTTTGQSSCMHASSDHNFAADETNLPGMQWGHVQLNTVSGNPLFNDPQLPFLQDDPRQLVSPEQLFIDFDGNGRVDISEAFDDISLRFELSTSSTGYSAGTTIAEIESAAALAVPDIIAAAIEKIQAWNGDGVLQHAQAVSMYSEMISILSSPGSGGFADLSSVRDFSGNELHPLVPLHMGAVQTTALQQCSVETGSPSDCNGNGNLDLCDILTNASEDCTENGIPDECEPDCNNNGLADSCDTLTGLEPDCNFNHIPDTCELANGGADCNANDLLDECEPDCNDNGLADACEPLVCGDSNADCITDSPCLWFDVWDPGCDTIARDFGDVGGTFGSCQPDAFINTHDRNHVLACFSEESSCSRLNIDTGGPLLDCNPDGFCNIHDVNHILRVFAGTSTCSCGGGYGGAAPEVTQTAHMGIHASRSVIRPNEMVDVHFFIDPPLYGLQSYQLDAIVSGGTSGQLLLHDILIEQRPDYVYSDSGDTFSATNVTQAQVINGMSGSVDTTHRAYLATYRYRAMPGATGDFTIDVDFGNSGSQTILIDSQAHAIGLDQIEPAHIRVVPVRTDEDRSRH
jgi:parallel beta-helix repeat protein